MNIIFMGTPVFAVPCLKALIEAGHNISYVFSQPDKARDRGQRLQPTPVKEYALEKGIEVFQPCSLRAGEDGEKSLKIIKDINPDCIVVVAYGQILPKEILDIPKYGCINVHASLLPRYRGAAPINYSIINGEKETGVSIMYMSEGLDAGDVINQESCIITDDMTYSTLHDKLMEMGSALLPKVLVDLEKGTSSRTVQDGTNSCYAPMITKQMCRIDWNKSAEEIYNLIRGLSQAPAAFTYLDEKRLKIYFSKLSDTVSQDAKPGQIIDKDNFTVMCGDKRALTLTDIQLEGNKRMETELFLRGHKLDDTVILK